MATNRSNHGKNMNERSDPMYDQFRGLPQDYNYYAVVQHFDVAILGEADIPDSLKAEGFAEKAKKNATATYMANKKDDHPLDIYLADGSKLRHTSVPFCKCNLAHYQYTESRRFGRPEVHRENADNDKCTCLITRDMIPEKRTDYEASMDTTFFKDLPEHSENTCVNHYQWK